MIRGKLSLRRILFGTRKQPQQLPEIPRQVEMPWAPDGSQVSAVPQSNGHHRSLDEIPEEELMEAIHDNVKNAIVLSDEWKRRKSDDRAKKLLDALGIQGLPPQSTKPVPRAKPSYPMPKVIPEDWKDQGTTQKPASDVPE